MNCHVIRRPVRKSDMGNYALFPVYREDHEEIKRLKLDKTYKARVWEPRNVKYHRLFFGLCNLVIQNSEKWQTVDQFRKAFLVYAGFVSIVPGINGVDIPVPDSMAFDKMDEETFDAEVMPIFWQVCARELGLDIEDLKANYEKYLEGADV